MLQRNLLYTGIAVATDARRLASSVGSRPALVTMETYFLLLGS